MKMPNNTLGAVREYFNVELAAFFDEREIDQLFAMAAYAYLNLEKFELRMRESDHLSESELLLFIYCVKDLKKNKPIQYILGNAEFYGLDFSVDENVLIPRPETEELVDWIVETYATKPEPIHILDIGTGSGCIAISIKKNLPHAKVYAMDVSPGALGVAQRNAEKNKVEIEFIENSILDKPGLTTQFDIIVSNPPYIAKEEASVMHANVLDFEPHLALFVEDTDALLFYKTIVKWGKNQLKEKGKIYFELNETNGDELVDFVQQLGWKAEIRKDLSGKDRMMLIQS